MLLLIPAFLLSLTLLAWGFVLFFRKPSARRAAYTDAQVIVAGTPLQVALAESLSDRIQGLSGRAGLKDDEGMLFVFPFAWRYSFWMKDMKFPIDAIWIRHGRIIDISAEVLAPTQEDHRVPRVFAPHAAADHVLEVAAGTAARHGWKRGDLVEIAMKKK